MEQLVEFTFERTRYIIFRKNVWGFFLSVAQAENDAIHIDIDLLHRDLPNTMSPRRFSCELGDGISFEMERRGAAREEITIWFEENKPPAVIVGVNLPQGAKMELIEP